jgi:hypothetical protein
VAIHVWCPRASDSAVKLVAALNAEGVRTFKSRPKRGSTIEHERRFARNIQPEDVLLNWGSAFRSIHNSRHVLNHEAFYNKRSQLLRLYRGGVLCPEVYDSPGVDRIGRSFSHHEGLDILNGTGRDFWTQKLDLVREVRVHIFRGLSIRAGVKVPRTPDHHPWVRTYAAGWKFSYALRGKGALINQHRDLAKKAIEVLKLDFGAVDIGITRNGTPVVLEVNTAPGLDEGPSVAAYVRHIIQYHNQAR